MQHIRTKIICTIGPAVNTYEKIIGLIQAGMNVARINFSHGTQSQHLETIQLLKKARSDLHYPLAIMLDTKGPEIRLGKIRSNEISLIIGQRWKLVKETIEGDETSVSITPGSILDHLNIGTSILFDDGYIVSKVVEILPDGVIVEIQNAGIIKSGKGVNIPNGRIHLPAMTEQDVDDIRFGCKEDIDIIAASFIRSPEHVLEIKKLLSSEKKPDILVIAKIENREGVQNFDSIIQLADGVMIARGDLGVEVPLSLVPGLQKTMIRKSYLAGKPAIIATQMLESMINNPRPTRAEVSDVANAIYDSASAVMLSGETAIGKYPFETVQTMKSIIKAAEADFNYRDFFEHYAYLNYHDVPSAVTLATIKAAYTSNAQAIFTLTSSGSTARLISRLRPNMPIIALTSTQKTYYQMACSWGVIPLLGENFSNLSSAFDYISEYGLKNQYIQYGDMVVMTAGSPLGVIGTTNMMLVENIGDVLVRGDAGFGTRVHGNITLVLSSDSAQPYKVRDKIIVITKCDETYIPLIEECSGIILQNHIDDVASKKNSLKYAKKFNKTILVQVDAACRILKEGQLVTIDPERALVYNRIIPEN